MATSKSKDPAHFLPLAQFQPHPPLNFSFQIVFANATSDPYFAWQGPNFQVPDGATVTLRPANGIRLNSQACNVAESPHGCYFTNNLTLAPGADVAVPYPVRNLNEIFAKGTINDGVLIQVTMPSVG